jgi:hypothetical protein
LRGLNRDWSDTHSWKRFRRTAHDHNPVHDALGNTEAFEEILRLAQHLVVEEQGCLERTTIDDEGRHDQPSTG